MNDVSSRAGLFNSTFRSLRIFNFRVWSAGALVSNIGTWMQRTAQDWLVLTQLTHNNATAMGIVMALQFGPQLLLLPWTGYAADHLDRRKLLLATQASLGTLALILGLLTVTGIVRLWEVYVFAFVFGCVTAFDAPARQTFVANLVNERDLSNAVGLNSTSFNVARMLGPAVAGLVIGAVGTGWAFLINAASFIAVLISLTFLRRGELRAEHGPERSRGGLWQGFRYVWQRADLRAMVVMLFLIGTFAYNFALFISAMAVKVFHVGPGAYGFLSSTLAVGSVSGALLAAGRERARFEHLLISALVIGIGFSGAALAPSYGMFALTLIVIGLSGLTFANSTNSLMQLSTEPGMRGRVMAIRLGVAMGTTPIGAPMLGWVADRFGPRWSLAIAAASGFAAAIVGLRHLGRARR